MNLGECMEYAQKLCDATTAPERNAARAELRSAITATVAAERNYWLNAGAMMLVARSGQATSMELARRLMNLAADGRA